MGQQQSDSFIGAMALNTEPCHSNVAMNNLAICWNIRPLVRVCTLQDSESTILTLIRKVSLLPNEEGVLEMPTPASNQLIIFQFNRMIL